MSFARHFADLKKIHPVCLIFEPLRLQMTKIANIMYWSIPNLQYIATAKIRIGNNPSEFESKLQFFLYHYKTGLEILYRARIDIFQSLIWLYNTYSLEFSIIIAYIVLNNGKVIYCSIYQKEISFFINNDENKNALMTIVHV